MSFARALIFTFLLSGILFLSASCDRREAALPPPNILWITSEDNSPFLGCYGDSLATTPNLDALAARGFLYTHAYAQAPVCAPSRNTLITGVYANSGGHQHMRSFYRMSDEVKLYPRLLRQAGYYCSNNVKEDFNIDPEQTQDLWDERGREAHYKGRPAGKPFFAIFNSTVTHESSLHKSTPVEALRHKPEDVTIPPYHPDTEEIRHDWAQYYDRIEDMDSWVGNILHELEENGEAENTIVFYYSDHGGVLGRSKRFIYESGTRVPLIVYIPEKYKHLYPAPTPGSVVERMTGLIDLPPTLLSIIGVPIPDVFQGKAFLGSQKTDDPEYTFMFRGRMDERYDLSHAVRDKQYRYIRNYMPHRPYAQYIEYLWRAPSMRSWQAACDAGLCDDAQRRFWGTKPVEELYHTERDPWEINNLANDPAYARILERMRKAHRSWMLDIKVTGFIPEAELSRRIERKAPYDFMRSDYNNLEALIDAADLASRASVVDLPALVDLLDSDDAAIRYWGATGLLILKEQAAPALEKLRSAARDSSVSVSIVAGEALYRMGEKEAGRGALLKALRNPNEFARTHALNAIECLNEDSRAIREETAALVRDRATTGREQYDIRAARHLLKKWGMEIETR